ncbi:MAG TPA: hypothetical protein VNJ53_08710 [Gaiellaceae bacterium]|nr:hypothetical protein [Gaiellaceae bacterium]
MRALLVLSGVLAALAAGCGGDEASPTWAGPPDPGADGSVAVDGYNAYLADVDEVWEGSAALVASHFLRLDERTAARTTIAGSAGPEGAGPHTVVVTLDGLLDDSVAAERWTLELAEAGEGYELTGARRELRCQPGRGHEGFAPEPCV